MRVRDREKLPTARVSTPVAREATKQCRHAVILAHAILGVDLTGALAGIQGDVVSIDTADIGRLVILADAQKRLLALEIATAPQQQ